MKYDVIIVASGKGERANLNHNKVFHMLKDGQTVLEHACNNFLFDDDCQNIIIVTVPEFDLDLFRNSKVKLVKGGNTRKDSVENGLELVTSDYVLIHDGARPFLDVRALNKLKEELRCSDACILVKRVVDTVKYVENDCVSKTLDRKHIYLAETPQAFKTALIKDAYRNAEGLSFTDDASLVEAFGKQVKIVVDEYQNNKLTLESDFDNI